MFFPAVKPHQLRLALRELAESGSLQGWQGQRLNHTSLISLEQTSPSSTLREPSSASAAATSLTVSSSGEVPITRDQSPHEVLAVAVSQLRGFSWCWLTLAAVSAPSASAVVFPSGSPTTSPCLLEFLANRSAQQGGSSSPREASGWKIDAIWASPQRLPSAETRC